MCFSAKASFVASGLLLAMGSATWTMAREKEDRRTLPLALAPLFFGLQQGLEGLVWLGIEARRLAPEETSPTTVGATVAFLFFAYAFWPVWMPWAAVSLWSPTGSAGKPWAGLPLLGLLPGLLLWLPLLPDPRSALPTVVGQRLAYPLPPWSEHLLPALVGPVLYVALIVLPLLRVPSGRVRAFALTLLLSFALTEWANRQALTSLWCYASALLSAQILWILWEKGPREASQSPKAGQAHPQT